MQNVIKDTRIPNHYFR